MAKSLAFWLEKPSIIERDVEEISDDGQKQLIKEQVTTQVELHFNYWSLQSGNVNYLDVGVRLSSITDFDAIKFYLPFDESSFKYVPELGKRVCDDYEMVSAIFNSPAGNFTPINGGLDFSLLKKGDESEIRFFYHFETDDANPIAGVKFQSIGSGDNKGTILTFPNGLFKFDKSKDGYFRFRLILNAKSKEVMSQLYDPSDSNITSHFETVEMVDFRLNEARNLPVEIRRSLEDDTFINSVHFFLIREASSEFKMSHSEYSRCRILEKDTWDKYLQEDCYDNSASQMLIYHWKKVDKEIDDFSAFAKFTRRHVKKSDIRKVIFYALVIGALSGIGANVVWAVGTKAGDIIMNYFSKDVQSAECILNSSIVEKINMVAASVGQETSSDMADDVKAGADAADKGGEK